MINGKHQLILNAATTYIRANLHTKLPIKEIAAKCYCSESLLSHCFTETME
jgi:AraC-like DNA-binding protein